MKIYTLKTCDSCRKATKFLKANNIPFEEIPIRDQPPTTTELTRALSVIGDIKKLFNTSGQDYRSLNMKEKLPTLSQTEAIDLLASNGNLIKRPLLISDDTILVGFKADVWSADLTT